MKDKTVVIEIECGKITLESSYEDAEKLYQATNNLSLEKKQLIIQKFVNENFKDIQMPFCSARFTLKFLKNH